MKLYFKHLHALSLFIGINIFFIPSPALAVNEYTTTKVIVTEGKVICFDLPKELALIAEKGETTVGKFIERIDEETCRLKAYSKLEIRNDIGSSTALTAGTSEIRQWVTQNDILWRTTE